MPPHVDPVGWAWLGTPAATAVIQQLWPEAIAERAIRERHETIVVRAWAAILSGAATGA